MSLLLPALALWLSQPAHAGACCVGSTSTVPTRLGECERGMAGLALGVERSYGQWSSAGQVTASSLQDDALVATLAGAWRWDRKGQIGLSLPARLNRKATDTTEAWGGGAGDLRVLGTWDPLNEWARGGEQAPLPVPILTGGLRLPTGTSWQEADGALLEDVTGLPGPAAVLGVSIERTLDRTPWSLGVESELGTVAHDDGRHLHPGFYGWLNVGRYLGTRWSVSGTLAHQESFAVGEPGSRTARTSLGARVTTARPLKWRAWAGGDADLPIPGLGRANLQRVQLGLGLALVR